MDNSSNIILGISGTIGAGKGTVVSYLVKTHGFVHLSARDFLLKEIRKEGLFPTRDVMRSVANTLRARHSPSYVIECLYAQAIDKGKRVIIESVRTVGEVEFLKSHGAYILAIDADRAMRYERIKQRGLSTDHVSFEEFSLQEDAELSNDDPNKQNILGVIKMSDFLIYNSNSYSEFITKIEEAYASLMLQKPKV